MLLLRRPVRSLSATAASGARAVRSFSAAAEDALAAMHCVDDFERLARAKLDAPLYEYLASGSGAEVTLRANRAAFGRYALRPRALRPVGGLSTATRVFGRELALPVFASPAGVHCLVDPEGECATARACGRAGTLFGLSQHATRTIEDVASAAPGANRLFQAYLLRDRAVTYDLVRRALRHGYQGVFLTVDSVRFGFRECDARNGFAGLPPPLALANYDASPPAVRAWEGGDGAWDQSTDRLFDDTADWTAVARMKDLIGDAPLVVKGVLTAEDAAAAVAAGADGVMVSNHGGRQLDATLGSLDALPEVVAAVPPETPVLLDSGARRGTDVVTALALGATAVGVGKPLFYALAVAGEEGVARLFELLREEVAAAMALCGHASVSDIGAATVCRRPP